LLVDVRRQLRITTRLVTDDGARNVSLVHPSALIPAFALLAATPVTTAASAGAPAAEARSDDDGPGTGTLMLRASKSGATMPAVQLGIDMDVSITASA
jgi:hypothetical protein